MGYRESYNNVITLAKLCHEVNRAYCKSLGDDSQLPWDEISDNIKESTIQGVLNHLSDDLTPEQSHEQWMKYKLEQGWTYGEIKDESKKTHPCIIPYKELPLEQKAKDYIFKAICDFYKQK